MGGRTPCILTSLLMFSLLLLLIWTLRAQSSAPMWVSVIISIHRQMKGRIHLFDTKKYLSDTKTAQRLNQERELQTNLTRKNSQWQTKSKNTSKKKYHPSLSSRLHPRNVGLVQHAKIYHCNRGDPFILTFVDYWTLVEAADLHQEFQPQQLDC